MHTVRDQEQDRRNGCAVLVLVLRSVNEPTLKFHVPVHMTVEIRLEK